MTKEYRIIEVSWEEEYLKGKTHPQSVKITTPGLSEQLKAQLYLEGNDSLYRYYERLPILLSQYPDPIDGVLDYKRPLDFMAVYYYRPGLVACISEKVKSFLDKLMIAPSECYFKPIKLKNQDVLYYILVVPMIPLEESGIIFNESEYEYNHGNLKEGKPIIRSAKEYLNQQDDLRPRRITLNSHHPRSIYNLESCSHIFYSNNIVEFFVHEKVTGARVVPQGQICSLCVNGL